MAFKKTALNYNKTMLIQYLEEKKILTLGQFFHMFKISKILKFVDYCVEEYSKTKCGIMKSY